MQSACVPPLPSRPFATVAENKRQGETFGTYSRGPSMEQFRACVEAVKLPEEWPGSQVTAGGCPLPRGTPAMPPRSGAWSWASFEREWTIWRNICGSCQGDTTCAYEQHLRTRNRNKIVACVRQGRPGKYCQRRPRKRASPALGHLDQQQVVRIAPNGKAVLHGRATYTHRLGP